MSVLRWFKKTGGGSRTDDNFHNYCVEGKTWLVWVYVTDNGSHMLLAGGTGAKVPKWLRK